MNKEVPNLTYKNLEGSVVVLQIGEDEKGLRMTCLFKIDDEGDVIGRGKEGLEKNEETK
jgi:hypothetical protein